MHSDKKRRENLLTSGSIYKQFKRAGLASLAMITNLGEAKVTDDHSYGWTHSLAGWFKA